MRWSYPGFPGTPRITRIPELLGIRRLTPGTLMCRWYIYWLPHKTCLHIKGGVEKLDCFGYPSNGQEVYPGSVAALGWGKWEGGQTVQRRRKKHQGGFGVCPPVTFWDLYSLACHFLHFGAILHNSEDYKTSYKIHKRQQISGLSIFCHCIFHINYKILFKNSRAFW